MAVTLHTQAFDALILGGGAAGLMVATSKDGVATVVCAKAAQDAKNKRAARMLTRRILEISLS